MYLPLIGKKTNSGIFARLCWRAGVICVGVTEKRSPDVEVAFRHPVPSPTPPPPHLHISIVWRPKYLLPAVVRLQEWRHPDFIITSVPCFRPRRSAFFFHAALRRSAWLLLATWCLYVCIFYPTTQMFKGHHHRFERR